MKRVELTAEAELDAFEIAHYYEQERAGLGVRFEGDLSWILERIGQNALQFPVVDGAPGVRSFAIFHTVYSSPMSRTWL